ncbi:ABC transporter permease subunit [Neobacillus sp. K501]
MGRIVHYLLRIICILLGFSLFLSIPKLFNVENGQLELTLKNFKLQFENTLQQITHFTQSSIVEVWLETGIVDRYLYTLKVLGISILLVTTVGLIISAVVIFTNGRTRNALKNIVNFSEAIPDLLIIFVLQIFVIILYKNTGIKFLQLYGFSGDPYFIPIVVVSFLPSLFLAQFFIKVFEEELGKDYVILAKAKGLSFFRIFTVHLFRNVIPLYLVQLRSIIWIILSNIVLIEFIFKIQGFTHDIRTFFNVDAAMMLFNFILFAIPIALIDLIVKLVSFLSRGKEEPGI